MPPRPAPLPQWMREPTSLERRILAAQTDELAVVQRIRLYDPAPLLFPPEAARIYVQRTREGVPCVLALRDYAWAEYDPRHSYAGNGSFVSEDYELRIFGFVDAPGDEGRLLEEAARTLLSERQMNDREAAALFGAMLGNLEAATGAQGLQLQLGGAGTPAPHEGLSDWDREFAALFDEIMREVEALHFGEDDTGSSAATDAAEPGRGMPQMVLEILERARSLYRVPTGLENLAPPTPAPPATASPAAQRAPEPPPPPRAPTPEELAAEEAEAQAFLDLFRMD